MESDCVTTVAVGPHEWSVTPNNTAAAAPPNPTTPHNTSRSHSSSHSGELSAGKDSDGKTEGERWIWVLDPLTRKLRVPLSQLVHTQATATAGSVPSLCISFLEGRCRHQWCRQAHVLPSAIPQLRCEALYAPTCCRVHDDPHDTSVLTSRFKYIRVVNSSGGSNTSGGIGNTNTTVDHVNNCNNNKQSGGYGMGNDSSDLIPTDRVAQTVGLLRFMAHSVPPPGRKSEASPPHETSPQLQPSSKENNSTDKKNTTTDGNNNNNNNSTNNSSSNTTDDREEVLELPAKLICRLHLAHRCRYLEDCNNIHICREYELRLQPPPHIMAVLASVTPATRIVTIGDKCYTTTPLSVGEVSDEVFHTICDQQRNAVLQSQQQLLLPPASAASIATSTSTPWHDTPVATAPHASPMSYGGNAMSCFGGSGTSPSAVRGQWIVSGGNNNGSNNSNNGSHVLFPANPENAYSGGSSPIATGGLQGTSSSSMQSVSPAVAGVRVLRIYDVRSKTTQSNMTGNKNVVNNSNSNNSMNGGAINSIAKSSVGGNCGKGNAIAGGGMSSKGNSGARGGSNNSSSNIHHHHHNSHHHHHSNNRNHHHNNNKHTTVMGVEGGER